MAQRITIAALQGRIKELEAELAAHQVAERPSRSVGQVAQPAPSREPNMVDYVNYWDYVRAMRKWHWANGRRVVSYHSREKFEAAHEGATQ